MYVVYMTIDYDMERKIEVSRHSTLAEAVRCARLYFDRNPKMYTIVDTSDGTEYGIF